MKNIFFLTLFIISFSVVAISQTITFDKTFPASYATQVLQTDDGGYLLNCSSYPTSYLNFVKTDQFGYIQWSKEYPEITQPGKKIYKTYDGGYIAVGNKLNGSYTDICLIKLDQNLDTIWTKTYGAFDQPETGHTVIQLPDSSFIISSLDYPGFYLRKTDVYGSLLWTKMIGGKSLVPSYLVNLNDGNFLFGLYGTLIKMNSDADTLWNKTLIGLNYSLLTNDGYILLQTFSYLQKLDQDGNILWGKDISFVKSFAQSTNDKYILLKGAFATFNPSPFSILTIDTSGNILSEISFEERGEYITNTLDGGFAICGSMPSNLAWLPAWLLKTDNEFNYTAISLRAPNDGQNLNIFNTYPIIWKANNVNYVNIEYSTDNQVTWNSVINYYPAEADTFNWTLPDMPSGNLFIRISDSFNPDVYDISDPPQTAINYQSTDYIAANEIFMWMGNYGMNSHNPLTDDSGFYWPGGEEATIPAIFADGLVWGGKVNEEIRVNGSTYRYGLTPGYILPSGLPSDPAETKSKMFKLKRDWQYLPPSAERDRYEFDFLNWPVDVGAPWTDNDNDGVYTLGIDEPKIIGDETLFFVANDLDTATSLFTYGSNPIGLEFQVTTFGYNSELLKDVVFKKYKIINKSPDTVTDMYLTYWTDDDLGYASDDYVGCDTLLNLGYTYNGDNDDHFYGASPPAVAHMIVQPPIVASEPTDSARFGDGWKKGYKNTPLSSFVLYIGASSTYADPDMGVYAGTLMYYNYMQGLIWNGDPFIDPNTGLQTNFCLAGDPVSATGWYEGDGWPGGPWPDDRRFSLSSGPFNIAPGDTQEVVIAFLIKRGTDNINSIAELKNYAALIQHWYDNDLVTDVNETAPSLPTEFSLSQNYPNPFNPVTVIRYSIPNVETHRNASLRNVTLKVYDILGREVITLVNEEKPAGSYEVEFDGSKLSSGVYFYRIQAGSFTQTKKMMVLK